MKGSFICNKMSEEGLGPWTLHMEVKDIHGGIIKRADVFHSVVIWEKKMKIAYYCNDCFYF